MKKILVVYEEVTNKLVPFKVVPPYGEIEIVSTHNYKYELRVNKVDINKIDFEDMKIIGDPNG
jgi:hypothetical protein